MYTEKSEAQDKCEGYGSTWCGLLSYNNWFWQPQVEIPGRPTGSDNYNRPRDLLVQSVSAFSGMFGPE